MILQFTSLIILNQSLYLTCTLFILGPIEDFSIAVKLVDVKARNYSLSAGQYFPVKIEYMKMTPEEFTEKMVFYQDKLDELFNKDKELEDDIKSNLMNLNFEERG